MAKEANGRQSSGAVSEQEAATLAFAGAGLPSFLLNGEGRILARNPKARALGGNEMFASVFERPALVTELVASEFSGVHERPLRLVGGRAVLLTAESAVLDDETVFTVALFDVTHYQMLSEESQLSQRLTAVGNLAAGVAYEISNPLTVLLGRLEFLGVLEDPDPALVRRHLGVMQQHAVRIASTVKKLQVFAHPALGVRESFRLSDVLQSAVVASQSRMGRVQIAVLVEPEDLSITGDPGLIEQVFTSLFYSVAEGTERRGRLVIRATENDGLSQVFVGGDGIPSLESDWERVEGSDQRFGFGPALASAIVREHSGRLYCSFSKRQISFMLEIPLAEGPKSVPGPDRWRVLFVDDDVELCALGRDMIEASGHHCRMAPSAEDALSILETECFDLIVADVRLPGISGLAFQERAVKQWPDLRGRIVLVTGLSIRPPEDVRLLQKPFTQSQLMSVLKKASADEF